MTTINNNSGQLRFFISLFTAVFIALLSGCAMTNNSLGQGYSTPAGFFQSGKVGHWINELENAKKLPPEQFKQILTAREIEYSNVGDLTSRLRLSLLLLQGQEQFRIPSRALKIMQGADLAQEGHEQAFGAFLLQLAEQQSNPKKVVIIQDSEKPKKGSVVRDSSTHPNQKTYLKEYRAAKARIKELEQQLLEITSIEQNIQERESGNLIKEQK